MARSVTMIPPTARMQASTSLSIPAVRRVCAYARVSTDDEEQKTSYDAQVEYYPKFISEHEGWEFVGLYADEGRSGTSTKRRKNFRSMIADALDGKIDLVITKSISRFARNTLDSISIIRQLKAAGVEVYFEKDGLWTFDPAAELTITILSSIAQEESRNLSQNVTWGMRRRFSDGKVAMPYKRFLGYDKGEDKQPVINPEQAELVRRIYRMCVDGMTPTGIARQLTAEGILTPGKKKVWQPAVVESILKNEKYKGDALLQKKFTVDFLTKEQKVNEGEVPQYYVEGSHPPIVSAELFDYVQHELQRRKGLRFTSSSGCFAGRVFCGECGSVYGVKVWHSNSKYRRVIWRCNGKYEKDGEPCSTPHFYEEQLKSMFVDMMNAQLADRAEIISAYKGVIQALTDTDALKAELADLQNECDVVLELMRQMVRENARAAGDQDEYRRRYGTLMERYDATKVRLNEVARAMECRNAKRIALEGFVTALKKREALLTVFNEELWNAIVERVVVRSAEMVIFILRDGSEVEAHISSPQTRASPKAAHGGALKLKF